MKCHIGIYEMLILLEMKTHCQSKIGCVFSCCFAGSFFVCCCFVIFVLLLLSVCSFYEIVVLVCFFFFSIVLLFFFFSCLCGLFVINELLRWHSLKIHTLIPPPLAVSGSDNDSIINLLVFASLSSEPN